MKSLRKVPKQDRSRSMVDSIFEAATRVFTSDGVERSSTNKIARIAGVGVGSLYYFFPNKDAVLAAWIEKNNESHRQIIQDELARNPSASLAEIIDLLIPRFVDLFLEKRQSLRILFQHIWRLKKTQDLVIARNMVQEILRDHILKYGLCEGMAPQKLDLRLRIAVNAFMGLIQVTVMAESAQGGPFSPEELKAESTALLKRYLCSIEA